MVRQDGKIVVAVKDLTSGDIRPGKILGNFRKREFADKALPNLARRECLDYWRVGVFENGKCLS